MMGQRKRHRRPVRRRIALATIASGALVVTATLLTAGQTMSAFTDQAMLNLGTDGVGAHPFDIVSVLPGEQVAEALPGQGVAVPISGDDGFVPGRTITVDLGVANNTPDLAAAVTVTVKPSDPGGTGQVGSSPNITPFLRVTVVDTTTGALLVGGSATDPTQGAPVASASGVIGRLAPRGAPALADGSTWVPGNAGSRHDLTITLFYVDTPDTAAYNNGRSALEVEFDGTSTP
ncbi:hypothetical protein [Leifsonia shinshuensis]|uniref:Uncharacterized protein n=2 Tax=Leifsonia shinshuensis TaxID=150026 RepID=A0A853CUX1_9MICO|nr:hypothetical protein [Leifsonia shinshuensis]NYJ24202.1 hypothetical protein [Leifsonia shinshuensis]